MKLKKLTLPIALILLATLQISGCATETATGTEESVNVRVVVTRDFGQQILLDQELDIPTGSPAMTALEQVAEVETSHGGGFVTAINGLGSENSLDWFIYFNGMQSNIGALDYTMRDGDVQIWDYHDWSYRMFTPAVIGYYPEPFLHGYSGKLRPAVIVYEDEYYEEANSLRDTLLNLGASDVSIVATRDLSDSAQKSANLILIGTIDSNELLSELNGAWDRLGFFVHCEGNKILLYDSEGGTTSECSSGCGVIQATQNPWNPKGTGVCENVAWMISGTDDAGVRSAVDILINHYDIVEHAFAVVVANSSVIKVPQ